MNFTSIIETSVPTIDKTYHETDEEIIQLSGQIINHIRERILHKNATKITADKDKNYLRISTLTGGCLRKDFYERTNNIEIKDSVDFASMVKMDMGTENHDTIQDYLIKLLHGVEEIYYDDDLMIKGANDGVFTVGNALFELKTIGFTKFHSICKKNMAMDDHIRQINNYIYLRNKTYQNDENYVPIDKGFILYWNRNLEPSFGNPFTDVEWFNVFKNAEIWANMGLPNLIKIFKVKYSEERIEEEKSIITKYWKKIEKNKEPAKTSKTYMCANCRFAERCDRLPNTNIVEEKVA